jgi:hypothetical protein
MIATVPKLVNPNRVCSEIEPNEPSGRANLPVSLIHPNCLSAELPKFSARQEPHPPFPNTLTQTESVLKLFMPTALASGMKFGLVAQQSNARYEL